jgi:putative transposase
LAGSKPEVYLHFVWATKLRRPSIPPELERDLYRVIEGEARRLRCQMLAINGMPDHVHLLTRLGRSVSLGKLMNQVKGVSSSFINQHLYPDGDAQFRWQPGYGVFSLGPNQVERAIVYILNQKRHHSNGKLWPAWEETGGEDDSEDTV